MRFKHNKALTPLARVLRKNSTKEEKRLWHDFLKKHSNKFIRQKVLGDYIADFYCPTKKLVIELDGSGHYTEKRTESDAKRTEFLEQEFGISVVRISNLDILKNFDGVCLYINYILENN